MRAAHRGRVPPAPEVRAAAERIATFQLTVFRRQRPWGIAFFLLLTAAAAAMAIASNPGWWVLAPVFGALVALHVYVPRHLRRRIELLQREPGAPARG
jgi:hypothetical protein